MLSELIRLGKVSHYLSFDVVIGALVLLHFFSNLIDSSVPVSCYIALGLVVWIIYASDHVLDAVKSRSPTTQRHQFHKRFAREIQLAIIFMVLIGVIVMNFLPGKVILGGLVLGFFVAIYLKLVHVAKKLWFKELLIAVIFSTGILISPVLLAEKISIMTGVLLMSQMMLLAYLNLLIFAYNDFEVDEQNQFPSLIRVLGKPDSRLLIYVIASLSMIASVMGMIIIGNACLIFFVMTFILMIVFRYQNFFARRGIFRVLGDGVFFIPILIFLG